MLKKIYQELVAIRKGLQIIRNEKEFNPQIVLDEKIIFRVAQKSICDNETKFHK